MQLIAPDLRAVADGARPAVSAAPVDEPLEQVSPLHVLKPIGQIGVDVRPPPDPKGRPALPPGYAAGELSKYGTIRHGMMPVQLVHVRAPALAISEFCHLPLYFEEVKLERHGKTCGILQPAVSAAHFFGTIPTLPYRMVVEPPRQCLSYTYPYEAGRRAPCYHSRYPIRLDAGLAEAGVIVGLIALIP
jgi:hypothetical protein